MSDPTSIPSQINSTDTYKIGNLNITGLLKSTANYIIDGVPITSLASPISFDSPIRCSTFEADAGTVSFFEKPARTPWLPSNISGLFGWYDASDSSTITHVANNVSAWADKSGKGYDLTVEETAPTTNSATLGGLNVISFDGSGNLASGAVVVPPNQATADWDGYGTTGNNNLTVFIVSEVTSWTGADAIFSLANATGAAPKGFSIQAGGSADKFKAQINGMTSTTPADEDRSGPSIYSVTIDYTGKLGDAKKKYLHIDGSEKEVNASTAIINDSKADGMNLRIFERKEDNNKEPVGICAEVVLCNEADEAARQATEGYLAHKWGLEGNLPSDHPYKTGSPKV